MSRPLLIGMFAAMMGGAMLLHIVWPQGASAVRYTVPLSPDAGNNPTVVVDAATDRTVVANLEGTTLTVLETSTGRFVTTVPVGQAPSALALDPRSGHVFVVNRDDDTVSLLDLHSGHILRTMPVSAGLAWIVSDRNTGRVAVDDGADGMVNLLDASSGRLLRAIPNPSGPTGTIYAWGGHVAVSDADYLQVFDEATGAVQYSAPTPGDVVAVDTRAGRLLTFEYIPAVLRVLDARNGALLSTYQLDSRPSVDWGPPRVVAVDERVGRFFVGDTGNARVLTLDAKSGRLVQSVALRQAPVALAADPQRGRVYAASETRLTMLDARSGRIVGTAPLRLNGHLHEIVVDANSGHIIIITVGGRIPVGHTWDWVPGVLRRWLPLPQPAVSARVVSDSLIMLDPSPAFQFGLHGIGWVTNPKRRTKRKIQAALKASTQAQATRRRLPSTCATWAPSVAMTSSPWTIP